MSLSKYFKKSDAFQPEEIVKGSPPQKEQWTPSAQQENKPFVAEKVATQTRQNGRQTFTKPSPEAPPQKVPPPKPTTPTTPAAQATPAEQEAVKAKEAAAPAPPPQTPVIDLEKYMDRQEAAQAIEEAYQRGCEDGRQKLGQDFEDAAAMLISVSRQLDTIRETLIGNSATEMQEFALAIAEKILRISVMEQDQTLIATIEEALQRAVKSDEFTVYVNPDDYDIAVEKAPAIVTGVSGLNHLVIKKDATIERGGAKLESDNCTIDASISSQFSVIRDEVRKRLS